MKFAVQRSDGKYYVFRMPPGQQAYVDWTQALAEATVFRRRSDAEAVARVYADVEVIGL